MRDRPEEHIAAAYGRVPAMVEAKCDGNDGELLRLLNDIPVEHAGWVAGALLDALYVTTVNLYRGNERKAQKALRASLDAVSEDAMEATVRAILHSAAGGVL